MLLINRILSPIGLELWRTPQGIFGRNPIPYNKRAIYKQQLKECALNNRGFAVKNEPYYDVGQHPADFKDAECAFAARHLADHKPSNVLDIGSYRHFVLGLLASYQLTTVDVRNRAVVCRNETVLVSDAKDLNMPEAHFDAIVSLCTLEHFGLARYGDEFDLDADIKAMREMQRVLKPGGRLIFSTNITQAKPTIAFNAHRIYSHQMICNLCQGLTSLEEAAYSIKLGELVPLAETTREPGAYDIYLGAWLKPIGVAC